MMVSRDGDRIPGGCTKTKGKTCADLSTRDGFDADRIEFDRFRARDLA
jgi:hypothetical protein